jgi:regulator of replication initiation timing
MSRTGSIEALESLIDYFGQESAFDAAMQRWEVEEVRQLESALSYTNQRVVEMQAEIEACRAREGPQIAENRKLQTENRKLQTAIEASRRQVQASARAAEVMRSRLAEREATQLARMAASEKRRTRALVEAHEQLMRVEGHNAVMMKWLERALMLLAAAVVVVGVGLHSKY